MKQIITILFLVIGLNSNASDKVHLYFSVKNGIGKEIPFYVFDNYITRDTRNYSCEIDSSGRGIISFKLDRPRETYFQAGSNHFLFLTPGDNISIEFDYINPLKTMLYKGKGSVHSNFILEYSRKYHDSKLVSNLMQQGLSNEEYKQKINERWLSRKAFYERYANENDLSREFGYYAQGLVDYNSIKEHLILMPLLKKRNKSIDDVSQFYSFLDKKYFENDSVLKYSQEYLSTATFFNAKCEKPQYDSIHSKIFQDLHSHFSNRTRDVLIATYLFVSYGENEYFDNDYKSFKASCNQIDVLNILENAFKKYTTSQLPKEVLKTKLISYYGQQITLKELLAKHKKNVIYIDFWSSFCAPCIKELPFLETIKDSIPELPLLVISFSVDGNPTVWKGTIISKRITTDNQYLLKDGFDSEICKYYSINSIPRFFLFDTNSRLASTTAPRASVPSIKEKILSLINSKQNSK